MWNRRRVVLGLGALLVAPSLRAQRAGRVHRIGFLESGSAAARQHLLEAFRAGMREIGYVEGRNLVVEPRWGNGQVAALPGLVAELLARHPDVLVAGTTVAALSAKHATRDVPIVFAVPADPVGVGLVASLRRPGGNATGLTSSNVEIAPKRLELLHEIAGKNAVHLAILFNPEDASNVLAVPSVQAAAARMRLSVQTYAVKHAGDFEPAFAAMQSGGVQLLVVAAGALTDTHAKRLAALAAAARIPAVYGAREFVDAGGLISYSASFSDNYRRAAEYVDRILKGRRPEELPVEQASKFELYVNQRAARLLGLQVPQSILVRADGVIE